jgi:signal transduction histidine kinase
MTLGTHIARAWRTGPLVLAQAPVATEHRRLLEHLPVGAYTCDVGGLITYYNPRAAELWGRAPKLNDPADRFCGSFRLYSIDGRPIRHDECWMARALRERRAYHKEEIVIRRPNGERVVALAHATPFLDDAGELIGAVNVLVDITLRKSAETALQRSCDELAGVVAQRTVQLTALSQHLIRVAEDERQHLAAELHDELGSLHAVIGMELQAVLEDLKSRAPDLVERQSNALKLLQQARDVKRRIIADLHPATLDHLGLAPTLEQHVERWSRTSGIRARVRIPSAMQALPKEAALALFRIAQESLTNVSKYARATSVDVRLAIDGKLLALVITDDGVGIPAETLEHPQSHGILCMRQRMAQCGGDLSIGPGPRRVGTRVCARLRLDRTRAAKRASAGAGSALSGERSLSWLESASQ